MELWAEKATGQTRLPLVTEGNTDTLSVSRSQSWIEVSLHSDEDAESPEQAGVRVLITSVHQL